MLASAITPLEELSARALAREPTRPAIEFERRWFTWGELRCVADRLGALIDASGIGTQAPVAFVPRNRPSAVAALLGLLAQRRTVRMVYAFQSAAALARDVERLVPAVLVAHAEDFSEELRAALKAQGSAAFVLSEMDAAALPGFERARRTADSRGSERPQLQILTSGTTGPPKQFSVSYELITRHHIGDAAVDLSQEPPTLLSFPLG